jgi:hypothetical protein
MRKTVLSILLILLAIPTTRLLGQASVAGSITGVVIDPQGAAITGAVVTVSSPALLTPKVQKSVAGGVYLIDQLPPGEYQVSVSMPGFKGFQEKGIVLTAAFTATVNINLALGDTSETVTVTGSDPVVDVESTNSPTTFSSELLANTPSGNDPWSTLAQTPGVTTSTFDVGGNNSYQQSSESVHGSKTTEQTYVFNGLPLEATSGTSTDFYVDPYSFSEAQVVTDAAPPEIPTGGAYLNMITRAGSNTVHGFVLFNYQDDKTQAQITPPTFTNPITGVSSQVLNAGSPFIRAYDSAVDLGGPVIRDRWWIFGAYRVYQLKQQLRASPLPDPVTGNPPPANNPGLYGFGTDVNHQENTTLRNDIQINSKNVFNAVWHWQYINRFYRRLTYSYVDQDAAQRQIEPAYIVQAQETFTPTSHMTLDTRIGYLQVIFPLRYQPGVAPQTISAADQGLSTLKYAGQENYVDKEQLGRVTSTLSYFKGGWMGSHNFKFGVDFALGQRIQSYNYNQDVLEIYQSTAVPNATPNSIRVENGPIQFSTKSHARSFFLQDAWTINRHVTLSLGMRYDHSDAYVPQQCNPSMGSSVFASLFPNRCIAQVQSSYANLNPTPGVTRTQLGPLTNFANVNSYDNVAPRLSVSYDPTGKGNQVIRAGFNMFTNNVGTSLADSANPNGTGYITYGWNGSFIANSGTPGAINSATPDYTKFAPACGANAPGTGGCLPGGTFTGAAAAGSGGYLTTTGGLAGYVDPNLKRPYSIAVNVGYQRTVLRDVSVGVAYYYRTTKNVQTTANINGPLTDYTPTTVYLSGASKGQPIINPLTGANMTLYGLTGNSKTCAASSNATDNGCTWTETTNNPLVNQNHYNGLEFTVTRRLVGKWSALVGFTIQSDQGVQTSGDFNDPNVNINRFGSIDQDSTYVARVDVTYLLPFKFQTSVNFQHETGFPITPNFTFAGLAPGQISETVNLAPNGQLRYPSVNDVNLRLSRITPIGDRFKVETACDMFNLFNVAPVTAETVTYGANFLRPTNFLGPFIARFNLKVSF